MDDAELDRWRTLLGDDRTPLRDAAAGCDPSDVAAVERLRRSWPADLVRLALALAAARRKAAGRLVDATELVADPEGVEQASSTEVARHKAARFRDAGVDQVVDLCCGIGGDAMELRSVTEVLGVDISPVRAWMTGINAACPTRVADVTTLDLRGTTCHLDPSRRLPAGTGGTRRVHRLADYVPGPAFIASLARDCSAGAVKLGPGVDLDELAPSGSAETEYINDGGTLVQAVLWTGGLARYPGERTATRLPDGLSIHGPPTPTTAADRPTFDRYLHVADPAVERAGLAGILCRDHGLAAPHPPLGLLTSAAPVSSPWLTTFAVEEQMPWRIGRVRAWLAAHDAGVVEVKTRGRAIDTDRAQTELRGSGSEKWTVFCLRFGSRRRAVITRRRV